MGPGEGWLSLWHVFLETLPTDHATRLAYLRRHPAAPINWWESVECVLHPPDADFDVDDLDDANRDVLKASGLIVSDAAYSAWRSSGAIEHPWRYYSSPRAAARYATREFWFWSRLIAEQRAAGVLEVPRMPWRWRGCLRALSEGAAGRINPRKGLLALARMLCAGEVVPPWRLGLSVDDFADTFDDEMGYVDAFRLWGMSALDDAERVKRFAGVETAPPAWHGWIDEELRRDG